ncbi:MULTISPECIES: hypothetical protein [Caproicibacterium]|uniref:Uncharacterized protein n=1 Tax=Caproicibacterium argilliputei TaxID=3030016 RepID=A0AA97DBM1_9FIRM|nr:hypothetical protein [Caproicibacterium argilliputei]WOC32789.1 hypothetical protein PXC00_02630 [Caproicibacterium argilliputei]
METERQPETAALALQSARSAHHRLDRLEADVKDIHALAQAMAATQKEMENMKEDMGDVKKNLAVLTARPGRKWELLVNTVIASVSTGLVSAALVLFLK